MKCIIVDDEEMSRMTLRQFTEKIDFLENVGEYQSGLEALQVINNNPPDLIFLDIQMPELTGSELIKSVAKLPQVIFTTSDKDFALEAFEYNVTDYLIKPIEFPRFLKAVTKAKETFGKNSVTKSNESNEIFVKVDSRLVKLNLDEVLWVEALGDYIIFKTIKDKYVVLSTLKNIESKLPDDLFVRVHRSYIVNISKIKDIEDSTLLIEDKVIPISRSNKENLMNHLNFL